MNARGTRRGEPLHVVVCDVCGGPRARIKAKVLMSLAYEPMIIFHNATYVILLWLSWRLSAVVSLPGGGVSRGRDSSPVSWFHRTSSAPVRKNFWAVCGWVVLLVCCVLVVS